MTFVEQMIEDTSPSEVYRDENEVVLFWARPVRILSLAHDCGLDIEMFSKVECRGGVKCWALSIPPEIADSSDED